MNTSTITITDMFCGAGGSSTGAVQAGAEVRVAINHWKRAIETHNTNHPNALHVLTDLSNADPRHFPKTTILIASPECTNHSLAKGVAKRNHYQPELPGLDWKDYDPAAERSRCLMWTPLVFAERHHYPLVILENVVDAYEWVLFNAWKAAWKALEYEYAFVFFNSMFAHPTPQSRDRMYFVAWKKGLRKPDLTLRPLACCARCSHDVEAVQAWKNPLKKYGKYRQQYVYLCPACAGIVEPYVYPAASALDWSLPMQRISERLKPLSAHTMQRVALGLQKYSGKPFLQHSGHTVPTGHVFPVLSGTFPTQTARLDTALVLPPAWLMSYYANGAFEPISEPVPTVTTVDRCALVTATQEKPRVEDCGFRMLEPHEIQAAMAFPRDYVVTGSRREKVKQLGNAVTPPVMQLLVSRCIAALA